MACKQVIQYLETGNISNSVNFPNMNLNFSTQNRLAILNENIPRMVGQITGILAEEGINISDMINRHRNNVAVTIIDTDVDISDKNIRRLEQISGVIRVRAIKNR